MEENAPTPTKDVSAVLTTSPDPVASYFNIVNPDGRESEKLADINKYLRGDKKEYDQIDNLRDLRELLNKLGTPPIGETLFDMAYQYARINSSIRQLENEKSRFER